MATLCSTAWLHSPPPPERYQKPLSWGHFTIWYKVLIPDGVRVPLTSSLYTLHIPQITSFQTSVFCTPTDLLIPFHLQWTMEPFWMFSSWTLFILLLMDLTESCLKRIFCDEFFFSLFPCKIHYFYFWQYFEHMTHHDVSCCYAAWNSMISGRVKKG